jgi:hypothetical protein
MTESSERDETGPNDEAEASELRDRVEQQYDFEEFGPQEMQEMSGAEWEAAFQSDSWITGPELLDRVESDLRARIERRDVFAVMERERTEHGERVIAYSDEGYAIVWPNGTVEGRGTVRRDVEPVVALCSMDSYEPDEPGGEGELPDPEAIGRGGSELGNRVMQIVGVVQLLAGIGLLIGWVVFQLEVFVPIVAVGFVLFGLFILILVANARLSDRFRAEEYRQRLEAAGAGSEDRPSFVPDETSQSAVEAGETRDGNGEP